MARADASVLKQLALEEYDERLAAIWEDVQRRLGAVMADLAAERTDSRSGDGTADRSDR